MARIRSIKPELRTSLTASQWPRDVRYFWVLLWGYLDDHGYGVDEPRLIKPDCFPLDDDISVSDIDKWLDLIASAGAICRFQVSDGRRFLHAPKWAEHQRPQHPAVPRFPACPRTSHETVMSPSHETFMTGSGASHETSAGVNGVNPEGAGQAVSGDSHETFTQPPESLTPEQVEGAGSREQGGVVVAREPRTRSLIGNAVLDEHRRLIRPSLPREVARKTGEHIDSLLADPDIAPDEIREALKRLRSNPKWGPGMLPHLVHEVRQEWAGNLPQGRASPSTTDSRVVKGLVLAAEYAEEERERRELPL